MSTESRLTGRNSRVIRRLAVVVSCLLGLGLAAILALVLYGQWRTDRAVERFEAVLGRPDPDRFIRPEVAESDNAATWLLAGSDAVVLSVEQGEFMGPRERGDAPWSAEEMAIARAIVEDNASALDLLRRAAGCSASSYAIDYRQGPDVQLPRLAELLRAGSVLWVDARLALAAGDAPRLRTDLETLDRLADSLARESLLVTALVAQAADRYTLDLVHRMVTDGREYRDLLAEAESVLGGRDRRADYLRSLAAEGSMLFSLSPELLSDAGQPPNRLRAQLDRLVGPLLIAALLDEFSAVGELVERPWPEVVAAAERRGERGFPGSFAVTLYPNLIDSIGKLKVNQSAGGLALEAVRQRRALLAGAGYRPSDVGPRIDPYSGREVTVEQRPDGTLVLAAPGALELWRSRNSVVTRLGEPHFRWQLPPPA